MIEEKKRTRRKTSEIVEEQVSEQTKSLQDELDKLKQENAQLASKLERTKEYKDTPTLQRQGDVISLEEMRQEDHKKVRGVFRSLKPAGGSLSFYFRKYKGDPIEKYVLEDGKEYELPLMVARHLNEDCYEQDKAYLLDANGDQIRSPGKRHHRFTFSQLEFGKGDVSA
ncbi:MAG: hypothetical protein PVF17_00700, partial [Ignavibacteria bacterium]|jgi:hypothetical protein